MNAVTGEIDRRVSFVRDVPVRTLRDQVAMRTETLKQGKAKRLITQNSNLLVGKYHYFRSYVRPWLGRVNVETGKVECLELPLQLARVPNKKDAYVWYAEPKAKGDPQLKNQAIVASDLKNSRGFKVVGDKRSHGNGWGHIASPTPTVAGDHLYVPVMNGTVYVIKWKAAKLGASAVVAINDLGMAGQSWTRASVSFAGGRAFAHTIRELICIGK